jgi:hypothetical protein
MKDIALKISHFEFEEAKAAENPYRTFRNIVNSSNFSKNVKTIKLY